MNNRDEKLYVKEVAGQYSAEKRYTYADYASWDDDQRYELIDGEIYLMSAPSVSHQRIGGEIYRQLANFLKGKPCEVFNAPFDVCLYGEGDDDNTVVQPDLSVVCDKSKLADGKRCNGAPDMVVEILSPSSGQRDRILKLNKYRFAGVREYWIVDPENKSAHVYNLESGNDAMFGENDTVPVHILDGCQINMKDVFSEKLAGELYGQV
jgi:Uma2 family endonuclease